MGYADDATIEGKKFVVLDMLDLVFNVRSPPHSHEMLVGLSKNMAYQACRNGRFEPGAFVHA